MYLSETDVKEGDVEHRTRNDGVQVGQGWDDSAMSLQMCKRITELMADESLMMCQEGKVTG